MNEKQIILTAASLLLTAGALFAAGTPLPDNEYNKRRSALEQLAKDGKTEEFRKGIDALRKEELTPRAKNDLLQFELKVRRKEKVRDFGKELALIMELHELQGKLDAWVRRNEAMMCLTQDAALLERAEEFFDVWIKSGKMPPEELLKRRREVCSSWRLRFRNLDKAEECLSRILDDKTLADSVRADLLLEKWNLLRERKKIQEAEALEKELLSDPKIPNDVKMKIFRYHAGVIMNNRKAAPESMDQLAARYLALPNLSPADQAVIFTLIAAKAKALKNYDKAIEYIRKTEVDPSNTARIRAARELTELYALKDNAAQAEAAARAPFALTGLTDAEKIEIQTNLGRLHEWQGRLDDAIACYREVEKINRGEARKLIADAYCTFLMRDRAERLYLDAGDYLSAARLYAARFDTTAQLDRFHARELLLPLLENEKTDIKVRKEIYRTYFFNSIPECRAIRDKYLPMYFKDHKPGSVGLRFSCTYGDYTGVVEMMDIILKYDPESALDIDSNEAYIRCLGYVGRYADAEKRCAEVLTFSHLKDPAVKYRFELLQALLVNRNAKESDLLDAVRKVRAAYEKDFTQKQHALAIVHLGQSALIARLDDCAASLAKLHRSFFKENPKRSYTVRFRETQVDGISDFLGPDRGGVEFQPMDRRYGFLREMLTTDVSSGNRGSFTSNTGDSNQKDVKFTELGVTADVNGLYIILRAWDPRAMEIKAGLLGESAYECYLAAGENQPYVAFFPDFKTGKTGLWPTTYTNEQNRRIHEEHAETWTRHLYLEDGYVTLVFFSWKNFYNKIPEGNDVWELEICHYNRIRSCAWNGQPNVHGRSGWGHLKFDFTPAQIRAIRKNLIFQGLAEYKKQKITNKDGHGILDFWLDNAVGDPAFYETCLKPEVEKLDADAALVKIDMSDADIDRISRETLPWWIDMNLKSSELRRKYLEKRLMSDADPLAALLEKDAK